MKISLENKIGEIVSQDYRTAAVFRAKGIDFCCRGQRTLRDLLGETGLDVDMILPELENAIAEHTSAQPDFYSWPLDLLVDYIEKKHHRYIRERVPVIREYLEKIIKSHGSKNPEFIELQALFIKSSDHLLAHIEKEEMMLFPMIRGLVNVETSSSDNSCGCRIPMKGFITPLLAEHTSEGDAWKEISDLTNQYHTAINCNVANVVFALLREFEEDLHLHFHLENNILFPRALEAENGISKTQQL